MLNLANKFFGLFGIVLLDKSGSNIFYENIKLKQVNKMLNDKIDNLVRPEFAKDAITVAVHQVIDNFSVSGDLNNLKRAVKDIINALDFKITSREIK